MRVPLFIAVFLILFVFGVDYASDGLIRAYVHAPGSAVASAVEGAVGSIFDTRVVATRRALMQENESLREELELRAEKAAQFEILRDENEALRVMARLAEEEEGITAPLLSSFRASPYGTFVIGAGIHDGVGVGSVVLTPGGFVLGTVTSADMRRSIVEALFAPEKQIELIVGDSAFPAEGRGAGNARAEVPRETVVAEGDVVRVSALASRPAGVIGRIESASSSPTATLYIQLPVNVTTLPYVYVIPLP